MNNEKLMILKMLEEGKITSDEAARLLESVDRPYTGGATGDVRTPPPATSGGGMPTPPIMGSQSNNRPGSSAPRSTGIDDLATDLGRRFEALAKNWEPRIQKLTETVAERTVNIADSISKSLTTETPTADARRPAAYTAHSPVAAVGGMEKQIELSVSAGYNELSLSGLNGDVRIKGYNGDKISARINYKSKRSGATIELMKLGGKYYLNYEEDDFDRVAIDAYVPERLFQVVNISGINGNMDISSLAAIQMQISNANGQTRLAGLAAESLRADCSTGRLTIQSVAADNAIIENFNGNVDAGELDIAKLSLTNYNGGLTLLMSAFARYNDYIWSVETSNAKLNMTLPTLPDLGYHIKAHTTLGEIRLGLTSLQFIINDPSLVEARSISFDRTVKKVKMAVETSNAPLIIN